MIYDRSSDTVFGYLGWVDQGSLWLYSLLSGAERRIAVEGADHLGVEPGLNGLFRLVHHGSADVVVSIRRYEAPEVELATLCVSQGNLVLAGETELWRNVDPAVIVRTSSGPRLVRVDPLRGNVTDLDLSWFTNGPYDLGTRDWSTASPCLSWGLSP